MGSRRETKSTNKPSKGGGSKRPMKIFIIALVAVVVVIGVWELGRYYHKWGAPDELRAIKAESLTKKDIPGLTVTHTTVDGMGSFISKIMSPRVERTFDIGAQNRGEAMQEIIDIAEADGWVNDPSLELNDEWWGRKLSRGFNLTTIIEPDADNSSLIIVKVF